MDVRKNIPRMYAYKFLSEFYLILPILIPYYKASGLGDSQVFIIQAVYTACFVLFEIPSGYLADVIGRRTTLILGAALIPAGLTLYVLSSHIAGYLFAEAVLAFAGSMRSGTDTALIYDSLNEYGETETFSARQGRTEFFTRVGTGLASILGGMLGLIALRIPFYVNMATGMVMVLIALGLKEPVREKASGKNPWKEILKVVQYCLYHPLIRRLMTFWAILLASGLIGVWAYFLYYQELKFSVGFYGVLYAIYQLAAGLGSQFSHIFEKKRGKRGIFFLSLFLAPSFALMGGFQTIWFLFLICLNGFLWNLAGPTVFTLINRESESRVRATVISTVNMAGSMAFVLSGPLFGFLSDQYSLAVAFYALGGAILVLGAPLVYSISRMLRYDTDASVSQAAEESP